MGSSMDFHDAYVLVTGGTRGIGRAVVEAFLDAGARVTFTYARRRDLADQLLERHQNTAGHLQSLRWVLDPTQSNMNRLFQALEEQTRQWDVIVYSAATGVLKELPELAPKHFDYTLDANVKPVWRLWTWFRDHARPGSSLVLMTSWGSQRVLPSYAAVGTTKAALEALCRYFAVDGARCGIRVNAVMPGLVRTDAISYFTGSTDLERMARATPLGRFVEPEEVARAVLFLAHPQWAAAITGTVLNVDGGFPLLTP